jgi:hypothetical protein
MTALREMFTPNSDGYDVTMPGLILLCADAIYGDDTPPSGQANAQAMMDAILGAAFAGGFKQGDILRTLLARNKPDRRTKLLAQAACDAAGTDRIRTAMASINL